MAPKNVKMDLSSFLADDTFGGSTDSWADDFDPTVLENNGGTIDLGFTIPSQEASIPENPPYTARIASFPQQTTQEDIKDFFWNNLALIDQDVEDFYCPKDADGSLKNFAFITFSSRELLIDALTLNDQPIHGKPVYVSAAKPSKNQRAPRQSRFDSSNDDFEWGSAKGSRIAREPRESRFSARNEDFEWGAARGSKAQPEPQQRSFRENREPREPKEPRAPRNDDFEWGAARGSKVQPEPQQKPFRENKEQRKPKPAKVDDFEWGSRGSMLEKGTKKPASSTTSTGSTKTKSEQPVVGPKRSLFSVLQTEDDDENDDNEEEQNDEKSSNVEDITKAATELSLEEENGWTIKK
ncbi:hypothetical protein CANINC_003304 [Pichia inconspicua]|uniref:RRM domain-containing protein n=1 Tax=Pichia inconspicua TaxID=52247 RepID=A0A4T0WYY0_9ASCO|nr:hypothetical protein CANINC_003304 [[Candida] inconspicua]